MTSGGLSAVHAHALARLGAHSHLPLPPLPVDVAPPAPPGVEAPVGRPQLLQVSWAITRPPCGDRRSPLFCARRLPRCPGVTRSASQKISARLTLRSCISS